MPLVHKVFGLKASRSRGGNKGAFRHAGADQAVHGGINALHGHLVSIVGDRPPLTEPIARLLDCGEFLDVPFRNHEVQGFAPIYFYHRTDIGTNGLSFNEPVK